MMKKKLLLRLHFLHAVGISVQGGKHLLTDNPHRTLVPLVERTDVLQELQVDALTGRYLLLLQKLQLTLESSAGGASARIRTDE